MKRAFILLALLTALQLSRAAVVAAQRGFDVKSLGLINGQHKGQAKLYPGQTLAAAIKTLGRPTKRIKQFDEAQNDTIVVFYYHANRLFFFRNSLVGFELNDNTLAFGKSFDQAFRVGAVLTTETKPVGEGPAAALSTRYLVDGIAMKGLKVVVKPGRSRNIRYSTAANNHTRYGDEKYDGWFELLFDGNNKVINIAMGDE